MSGVKEASIMKYAEYLARGGFAVLAHDNINFGDSGGEPRQEVDPALQLAGPGGLQDLPRATIPTRPGLLP